MTTALKLRRGTTTQHSTFTGAAGEVTVDTTKNTVVVHDNSTAGGFPLAKESAVALKLDAANPSYTGTLTGGTGVVNIGSGQLYKDASGNVGIGTNSPSSKLDIAPSSGLADLKIRSVSGQNATFDLAANGNTVGTTSFQISQLSNSDAYVYQRANANLIFGTNNSERMRIDSSGNLGIGNTNPSHKLTVSGTVGSRATAGTATLDVTEAAVTIANGGTVNFSNMAGMLVQTGHTSANVTIWLMNGGSTSAVSSVNGTSGTLTFNSGINGYTWTNNSGMILTVSFFTFRGRQNA